MRLFSWSPFTFCNELDFAMQPSSEITQTNTQKDTSKYKKKQVGLFNSFGNVCAGCFDFSNLKMLLFCTNAMLKSDIQPAPSVLLAQKVQKVCTLSCLRRSQKGCYAMTEQHLSLKELSILNYDFSLSFGPQAYWAKSKSMTISAKKKTVQILP